MSRSIGAYVGLESSIFPLDSFKCGETRNHGAETQQLPRIEKVEIVFFSCGISNEEQTGREIYTSNTLLSLTDYQFKRQDLVGWNPLRIPVSPRFVDVGVSSKCGK